MSLTFFVPGNPAPQGSKRHVGKGIMIESSKALKPWRESIRWAAIHAERTGTTGPPVQLSGPVAVALEFVMKRPASTPKRKTPPAIKRPDVDKLARAALDALSSAGTWADDSQVTTLMASKRLAEIGEAPGLHIHVSAIEIET